jgi:hypothetical protein
MIGNASDNLKKLAARDEDAFTEKWGLAYLAQIRKPLLLPLPNTDHDGKNEAVLLRSP